MKDKDKNRYHSPLSPAENNNRIYTDYISGLDSRDYVPDSFRDENSILTAKKRRKTNKKDIYHLPGEGEDYQQDAYTVAQNFLDRSQFPY